MKTFKFVQLLSVAPISDMPKRGTLVHVLDIMIGTFKFAQRVIL
jgi:hypothetical protein